ncbi:MAG: hypothetical protein ABJB98_02070 [Actinomycetota bacterium]
MSYQDLWVVTFIHPSVPERVRVAGPFPAEETAQEFARRLRAAWQDDEHGVVDLARVESTDPIEELLGPGQ